MIKQIVRSKFIKVFMVICMILAVQTPVHAQESSSVDIKASAAILVEASTGKIVYEKNVDEALPIASMTKMMTTYLVQDAIKEGKIKWDDKVKISDYAHRISQNTGFSNVPLEIGQDYSVKELYQAMAIYSANGASIALAEKIAGSEQAFVDMMNKKAEALDLKDYRFVNSNGLSNKDLKGEHPANTGPNDENKLSARGCAKLAYHLITDYPEVLDTSKIAKLDFYANKADPKKGIVKMDNWNWMLPGLIKAYEGMDGLKTGSTDEAGSCFTGTAKRGNLRYISVVLNTATRVARFDETKRLLDYGYNNFELKEAYPAGYAMKDEATLPVLKGKEKDVKVGTKEALSLLVKKGSADATYKTGYKINDDVLSEGKVVAPIKEGDKIGTMYIEGNDFLYPNMAKADLVAMETVDKANWFTLSIRSVGSFFSNMWSKVTGLF